jgi:hypothetical protein
VVGAGWFTLHRLCRAGCMCDELRLLSSLWAEKVARK